VTDKPGSHVFVDDLPKTHDVRYGLLFLIGLVVSAVALYAVGYFVAGNKVPSGTTIAGVDVGGMTRGEALIAVQEKLVPRISERLVLVAARHTYSVDPQRSGLAFDAAATVSDAMYGSDWDPRHMLQVLIGGHAVKPVVVVDGHELAKPLRRISHDVDRAPRNASVSFATGGPQVRFGHTGQRLNHLQATQRMVSALQSGDHRVVLPVRAVQPEVTDAQATTFARTVGTSAVKGSATLRVASSSVQLRPGVFVPALTTRVVDSSLRLAMDSRRLYARSQRALASVPGAPVNATLVWGGSKPVIVPGHNGTTVSPTKWSSAVLRAVSRPTRRARAATTPARPSFTAHDAAELGVRTRIATDHVRLPSTPYGDLTAPTRQLGGTWLKPGETMSFHDTVDSTGDLEAVSSLAGATYTAAFRAGMTVLERAPEKHYSGDFPEGLGARVSSRRDLVLRNDSRYGVFFATSVGQLRSGGATLTVDIWSSKSWRVTVHLSSRQDVVEPRVQVRSGPDCSPRLGAPGFAVDVTRTFQRSGHVVHSDVTHTSYAPLDAITCRDRSPRGRRH
jgi:vancomycin resistance protein YoaR